MSHDSSADDLHGLAVLVTRPEGEAATLRRQIAARGGIAICQPGLALSAAPADEPTLGQLRRIAAGDWLVFTSPAAVRHGWPLLDAGRWPAGVRLWAVGKRTAADLKRAGAIDIGAPRAGAGSDALLRETAFADVRHRRVLILCARGGRAQLQNTLKERGARVHSVYVYRRRQPRLRPAALARLGEHFYRSIVVATSADILANVTALFVDRLPEPLNRRPLVVVSQRIAGAAAVLGYARVAVSDDPSPEGILAKVAEAAGSLREFR